MLILNNPQALTHLAVGFSNSVNFNLRSSVVIMFYVNCTPLILLRNKTGIADINIAITIVKVKVTGKGNR